jgi:preprotein translocase subunit YajC
MKKIFTIISLLFILASCSFNKPEQKTEETQTGTTTNLETSNETETQSGSEGNTDSTSIDDTQVSEKGATNTVKSSTGATNSGTGTTQKKAEEEKIVKEFEKEIDGLFNLIEKDGK